MNTNRKPVVLEKVALSSRVVGRINNNWDKYNPGWTPLTDENFIELWQKSDSLDHFIESYTYNHPKGKCFKSPIQAASRYYNRDVDLRYLDWDPNPKDDPEVYNQYLRAYAQTFMETEEENDNEI
jgi:hypothetical protein